MPDIENNLEELSGEQREDLQYILDWDDRESFKITRETADLIRTTGNIGVLVSATRPTHGWTERHLREIGQMRLVAQGLINRISDNPSNSPMTADPNYVSQLITKGHIRNAHYFQRGGTRHIRRATVVNAEKLPVEDRRLAQDMVRRMNNKVAELGRPVSFNEYVAMHR
jgi:hypothetical protein